MRNSITWGLIICANLWGQEAPAQKSTSEQSLSGGWEILAKVTYKTGHDKYGEVSLPVFNNEVKKLAGKEIILTGYIVPFDDTFKPDHIIISSQPAASCFFCGGAGPESVAEVYLKVPVKYTDGTVRVKGRLELNDTDYDHLMYILKDAVALED